MPVIRVEKNKNYTSMSNHHLRNKDISLKAKGLMSQMLSLPDNWDYSIAGLAYINKESETSVKSALKELKDAGYLEIKKLMPDASKSGRIEYEYILHEIPVTDKTRALFQYSCNQAVENQAVENVGQINTNIINTNKQNTKISIEKESIKKESRFIPPSVDEITDYCDERNNNVDPQRFYDYYSAKGWMIGKNKMKDWKAAVRTWERQEQKKSVINFGNNSNALPFDQWV